LRRLKSCLGPGKAIAATTHELVIIMFNMLKKGMEYIEIGQDYYETQYREKLVKHLSLRVKSL
jgi:transposase